MGFAQDKTIIDKGWSNLSATRCQAHALSCPRGDWAWCMSGRSRSSPSLCAMMDPPERQSQMYGHAAHLSEPALKTNCRVSSTKDVDFAQQSMSSPIDFGQTQ